MKADKDKPGICGHQGARIEKAFLKESEKLISPKNEGDKVPGFLDLVPKECEDPEMHHEHPAGESLSWEPLYLPELPCIPLTPRMWCCLRIITDDTHHFPY